MKINFLNQYFKTRASDNNASDLVNMYLEEDKDQGKHNVTAYPTPGKTVWNNESGSVVRGGINHEGVAYFVVDDTFYSYDSSGVRTSKGTLSTSTGRVQLASIPNQIEIIDDTNIYNYSSLTGTFTTVSDADKPVNPIVLAAQDNFFLFGVQDSDVISGCDIADGTSFNALSFATKNGDGDYVNGLISNKRNVHVLGTQVSEIWYNSGASTFSFESLDLGAIFHYGCAARHSVARGKDNIFYLGQSEKGGYCVLTMDQYKPVEISSRAISYQLSLMTSVSDAFGYCYRQLGHEFYVLTFPTDAKTFMYDTSTGLWSELQSYVSGSYTRDISNCHVYAYGKNLVGDYASGKIFYLDPTVYQENGVQILRRIVTPPGYVEGKKLFVDRLQVDLQTGVGSNLTVDMAMSKDSGQTYTSFTSQSIPAAGGRMFWSRLGMTQTAITFKLSTTSNSKFCVLGAVAELRKGNH